MSGCGAGVGGAGAGDRGAGGRGLSLGTHGGMSASHDGVVGSFLMGGMGLGSGIGLSCPVAGGTLCPTISGGEAGGEMIDLGWEVSVIFSK